MAFVYAIECDGLVKIGVAKNPHSRLAALQTGNPHPMTLLAFRDFEWRAQAYLVESGIHDELRNQHVAGEWFRSKPVDPVFWLEVFHKEHRLLVKNRLACA